MFKLPHLFEHQNSAAHNLYRLFMLRNLLIGAAVLLVAYISFSEMAFPVFSTSIILSLLFIFNLFTAWWLYNKKSVTDSTLIWQLVADIAAFTGMLYFTGGASNPFGWFYLVPIFIAATLLQGRTIWLITALSMAGYTTLMFFYQPLAGSMSHDMHMQHNGGFAQHIMGMWLGYMVTAILVAYVVARMANSLRERDNFLAQARESALRDERLVALGTLAAGTAHELGTPLSTIAIIVKEMQQQSGSNESLEYLDIIRQQVERCKTALATLSHSAGEELMSGGEMLNIEHYISSIIEQWQYQRPNTKLDFINKLINSDAQILAEQTMTQALINILNNAADASPENITLILEPFSEEIMISIIDNGTGLDAMSQSHAGKQSYSNKEQGLGLGLFLAHASIERLGGKIFLSNHDNGGAMVKIILPLTQLELGRKDAQ